MALQAEFTSYAVGNKIRARAAVKQGTNDTDSYLEFHVEQGRDEVQICVGRCVFRG